jgi:hypothetical protein
MASSRSRRLSSSTGSPIACRRRGSTGIAITESSRRITGCGKPSRRWRKGNIGKRPAAATGGHGGDGHGTGGCCDTNQKPRSHDTSRIAWAKLMARVGEEFPLQCPNCGGDIRLIAFITEPAETAGRSRLTSNRRFASGRRPGWLRPCIAAPPPVTPARGLPTDWGELVQVHDDRDIFQASPQELPAIDIHSL